MAAQALYIWFSFYNALDIFFRNHKKKKKKKSLAGKMIFLITKIP